MCRANLERALTAFLENSGPTLDAVRKTGRAQARQGIPLAVVLRAFRIAGTVAYETLLKQAGPGVVAAAPMVAAIDEERGGPA